jgi:hypothetical protein
MTMDEWYTLDNMGRPAPWANDYWDLTRRIENRKKAAPPCTCDGRVVPQSPCNVFRRPVTEAEHDAIISRWDSYRDRWQVEQGLVPDMKAIKKKRKTPPYTLSATDRSWLDIEQALTTTTSKPSTEDLVREKLTRDRGRPPTDAEYQKYVQGNHLTPKDAGGCPTGSKNLQSNSKLCRVCQGFEDEFTRMQSDIANAGVNRP